MQADSLLNKPFSPFIFFEINNGISTVYYTEPGIEWTMNKLGAEQEANPAFFATLAENFKKKVAPVNSLLEKNEPLDLSGLKVFMQHCREIWMVFDALWWSIEFLDEHGKQDDPNMAILQEARLFGGLFFTNSAHIIKETLQTHYPELGGLANALSLEEALSGKIPSLEKLQERWKHSFFVNGELLLHATHEDIEKKFGIRVQWATESEQTEFKGQTAFPGKAQGKIRKIISVQQVAQFQKGEILLAPTTLPSFLPAMHKAAGIISDEGGLISHAAIVARELKKPCVIGTKNCFESLTDGDLVEVDADQGIVRKLSG